MTIDEKTIASELQKILNENSKNYNLVNYGGISPHSIARHIQTLNLRKEDIIILILDEDYNVILDKEHYDLSRVFDLKRPKEDFFLDRPIHCNYKLSEPLAQEIYTNIEQCLLINNEEMKYDNQYIRRENKVEISKELLEYMSYLKRNKYADSSNQKIGCIVMNCNPFTIGHRYLIEYASTRVDYLYIFVVEENKSFFSFADRFQLVEQGVNYIQNCKVLKSGNFIISSITLPGYFEKDKLQDYVLDATEDLDVFCQVIAQELDINIRFAGNEPLDMFTMQYNQEMLRILPQYKIDFCEIPRKEINGVPISASRVRKLLESKEWEEIKRIVPTSTFEFLYNQYN